VKKLAIWGLVLVALTLALVLPAQAAMIDNQKLQLPIGWSVWIPCANGGAGEIVEVTGYLHQTYSITNDGAGGYHVVAHAQLQGSGIGNITGDKYQVMSVGKHNQNTKPPYPYEETNVYSFSIIGKGPGANYLVHGLWHMTINANGNITSQFGNWTSQCK